MTAADLVRWLAETSFAVSLLILLVLIVRKPFAHAFGARAAYFLWLIPAARVLLPELNILPAPETLVIEPAAFTWQAQAVQAEAAPPGYDWANLFAALALFIWATVAFAWFSLKLEDQKRYLQRRLAESNPAGPAVMEMAGPIAKSFGLRRVPRIRISKTDDEGPCLVGLIRPVVFLPAAFERDYEARERRLALAHEFAHVARGDMGAMLVALALKALQWPNPLAHLSFNLFRTDQEAACDAYVLARCHDHRDAAGDYAAAILKSVRAGAKTPAYGLALAHPVKERLMLIKKQKKSPLRFAAGAVSVAAIAAAGLAATASYGFAEEPDDKKRVEKREIRLLGDETRTISVVVDGDETLDIKGVDGAHKIEITQENGDRTVKIYDEEGELISENTYGPDDAAPFNEFVIKTGDGESKTITLAGIGARDFSFFSDMDFDFDTDVRVDGEKRFMVFNSADRHDIRIASCGGGETGGVQVFEWTDEDRDENTRDVRREVFCVGGAEADPEKRAEALKKAIEHMEESARRDAERRKEMIANMRKQLREAEREARNN